MVRKSQEIPANVGNFSASVHDVIIFSENILEVPTEVRKNVNISLDIYKLLLKIAKNEKC